MYYVVHPRRMLKASHRGKHARHRKVERRKKILRHPLSPLPPGTEPAAGALQDSAIPVGRAQKLTGAQGSPLQHGTGVLIWV